MDTLPADRLLASYRMEQVARNATMENTGYLNRCRYLLHDRDNKFCREFRETLAANYTREFGVKPGEKGAVFRPSTRSAPTSSSTGCLTRPLTARGEMNAGWLSIRASWPD